MGNIQTTSGGYDAKQTQMPPLPQIPQNLKAFFEELPKKMKRKLRSPGLYENLDDKWKSLQPETFEGLKVIINQEFNSNVKLMHTINLSSPTPGNYQFKANVTPYEETPMIWCELDETGVLKGNVMHQVNERVRVKAITHFDPSYIKLAQVSGDYCGDDYTGTLMLSNFCLQRKTGLISTQCLKSITKEFTCGAQLALQLQPQTTWDKLALTICGRYALNNMVCTGSVRKHYAQLRVCHDISRDLKLGVQGTANFANMHAAGKVCYEIRMPQYSSTIRGAFDTFGNVCCTIEQRMPQYPLIFTLSSAYNYIDKAVKVGASFTAY